MSKECVISLGSIDDVKEFVAEANKCTFDIDLTSGRYVVDAKSIMGIFSLDLSKSLKLTVHSTDDKAEDFLEEIKKFITD